jgi:large conductance mechanosensitive channel
MSFIKEFREFAMRGNVIDLAVGVVIGGAFQKTVDSLVKDLLMPPLGLLIGGVDFGYWKIPLGGNAAIAIGSFVNAIVQFTLLAFAVFVLVKFINRFHQKNEEKAAEEKKMDPQIELLTEIRDLLKQKQ